MSTEADQPVYGFPSAAAEHFPSCVQLTLCHYICDCACISCPVGRMNRGDAVARAEWEAGGGEKLFMTWPVFKKAARETGGHPASFMRFHARGEPTLHPQFADMIAFAKSVGVATIQVFSNGISMDERLARRTLDAGLDVIEFSIHGHAKTYASLMGNDHFAEVVHNVERFVKLRNDMAKPTKVVVSAVDQPGFQTDKDAHRRFWTDRVDQVILRPYHSWGGRIPCESAPPPVQRHPCPQLWTRLTIGPTGNVLFCFNSWNEAQSETAANLMSPGVSIASVWQSLLYNQARADHLAGNYTLPCCATCSDWVGSSWGGNSYEALLHKLRTQAATEKR